MCYNCVCVCVCVRVCECVITVCVCVCVCVTYSAGPRVGDLPGVGDPLVVGALLVGEGPVEDGQDVSHVVHAHGRAFEHRTETHVPVRERPK